MTPSPTRRALIKTIRRLNALRLGAGAAGAEEARADPHRLEQAIERQFGASRRLATYGSLMPGRENAHHLDDALGTWRVGTVRGRLHDRGWGSGCGFPGLVWDPEGPGVPVRVLTSADLPARWPDLDEFEGAEYLRILVPVLDDQDEVLVANLYALRG